MREKVTRESETKNGKFSYQSRGWEFLLDKTFQLGQWWTSRKWWINKKRICAFFNPVLCVLGIKHLRQPPWSLGVQTSTKGFKALMPLYFSPWHVPPPPLLVDDAHLTHPCRWHLFHHILTLHQNQGLSLTPPLCWWRISAIFDTPPPVDDLCALSTTRGSPMPTSWRYCKPPQI